MTEPNKPDEKRAAWLRGAIERLQAELDGREYECDGGGTSKGAKPVWRPSYDLTLFPDIMYRAKPQPKHRPFTPKEATEHLHVFCNRSGRDWVSRVEVWSVTSTGVEFYDRGGSASFQDFVDHYTFDDGTPCGVLVTEGEA